MIAGGSPVDTARCVVDRLVGLEIPPVVLEGGWERALDLRESTWSAAVIYFYPGCGNSAEGEETSLDFAQHRAFRDHHPDLQARGCCAIGVSSQSQEAQWQVAHANAVTQKMLCDPQLELARELGLPTFTRCEARWYERLVMVVIGGRIEKVFFPVACASRSAAQVIAWMILHGGSGGGGDVAG